MTAPEPATDGTHTVVIGAGSAGITVAVGLARLGRPVVLIECTAVGGDCTNVGCIPSKTLIHLARALGPASPRERADGTWHRRACDALATMRARRDSVRAHEEHMLAGLAGLELVRGRARLARRGDGVPDVEIPLHDGSVRVVRPRAVVIATGAEAVAIDVPGLPADRTLTNATLFDLGSPPAHLAIVGAGAIGSEMAFAFANLGSTVTLIDLSPRILPRSEPTAAAIVHRSLEEAGVRVVTGASATHYDPDGGVLHLARGDEARTVEGVSAVLMAIGRRPNVAGLGLEGVGVRLAPDGAVLTDRDHRTNVPGVYAIGDVTGRVDTTHAANAQGRRVVRRLALPLPLLGEGDYPSVVFSRPEVAQIGPTLEVLRQRYRGELLVTHRVDLIDTDRGLTLAIEDGFVSVTAMRLTGRVLAATIVGPGAGEMIHLLTLAQRQRMSLWRLSRLVVAYPALSAAIRQVADAFVFESLPRLHRDVATYLRHRWRTVAPA